MAAANGVANDGRDAVVGTDNFVRSGDSTTMASTGCAHGNSWDGDRRNLGKGTVELGPSYHVGCNSYQRDQYCMVCRI